MIEKAIEAACAAVYLADKQPHDPDEYVRLDNGIKMQCRRVAMGAISAYMKEIGKDGGLVYSLLRVAKRLDEGLACTKADLFRSAAARIVTLEAQFAGSEKLLGEAESALRWALPYLEDHAAELHDDQDYAAGAQYAVEQARPIAKKSPDLAEVVVKACDGLAALKRTDTGE